VARDRRVLALQDIDLSIAHNEFAASWVPPAAASPPSLIWWPASRSPVRGQVRVAARPVEARPQPRRGLSERRRLFSLVHGVGQRDLGPRTMGVPAARNRPQVEAYIDQVGLRGFGGLSAELSGG